MDAQLWRTVRWYVALGVCVLIVVVAVPLAIDALTASLVFGDGEEADEAEGPSSGQGSDESAAPSGQVTTGPVTDGDTAPEADFVVRNGTVRQADSTSLSLREDGDVVVAVFPLVEGDPACVALAELEMELEAADPTELGVYASRVHTTLADGDEVDADPRLDNTVRALAITDGTPGRLRWDVTDLYRAWATGELAPAGTPFSVAIAAPETPAEVVFSSAEAATSAAPTLVWQGTPGCGQEG